MGLVLLTFRYALCDIRFAVYKSLREMGKRLDKTVKYAILFDYYEHAQACLARSILKDLYPIPVSLVKPKFVSQEVPAWSFAQVAVVFLHPVKSN